MLLRRIILAGLVVGCAQAEPKNTGEQIKADFEAQMAKDPCVRLHGNEWEQLRWRDCLQFRPAERMRGVWYTGFEESGFVPDVDKVRLKRTLIGGNNPEFDIYLDIDRAPAVRDFKIPAIGGGCTQAIAVEFIGRRSAKSGPYYTGKQDYVIAVDKLLSAHFLGIVSSKFPDGSVRCADQK